MWIKPLVKPGIAERSVETESLSGEQQNREENEGEEELVEPLVSLKVQEMDDEMEEKEEHVEPLVRLVRYDSSIPNALDRILPRYVSATPPT